jgi:hypothetical protein
MGSDDDRFDAYCKAMLDLGSELASDLLRDLDLALLKRDDGTPESRESLMGAKLLVLTGAINKLREEYDDLQSR